MLCRTLHARHADRQPSHRVVPIWDGMHATPPAAHVPRAETTPPTGLLWVDQDLNPSRIRSRPKWNSSGSSKPGGVADPVCPGNPVQAGVGVRVGEVAQE